MHMLKQLNTEHTFMHKITRTNRMNEMLSRAGRVDDADEDVDDDAENHKIK